MVRTTNEEIERILDTLVPLDVRARAMFGGHALYCDEKVVALIMEGRIYIKPSGIDGEMLDGTEMVPPYPSAKPYHLVPEHLMGDSAWLTSAIQETANALPAPKPRTKKERS